MLLKKLDLNKIQKVLEELSEITENVSRSELWSLAENEINFVYAFPHIHLLLIITAKAWRKGI